MKPSELSHDQRMVLIDMLVERRLERGRMRVLLQYDSPFPQTRWDVLNAEMTMLYVLLGEFKRRNPMNIAISEATKKEFWHECQTQFAKAHVDARKPQPQIKRKYQPRNDPSLAFGD